MKRVLAFAFFVMAMNCLAYAGKDVVDYRADFEKPSDKLHWKGWAQSSQSISISPRSGVDESNSLEFRVSGVGWNTGILTFPKPIKISKRSVLRMYYKGTQTLTLNITNATERVMYILQVAGQKEGQWYKAEVCLADAVYKKSNAPRSKADGLEGDYVSTIQFATCARQWWMDEFEIVRVAKPLSNKPLLAKEYVSRKYEVFDKVFPFGVIVPVNRHHEYATMFGQNPKTRMEDALIDIKRKHLNTFANFCDSSHDAHVLAEKYGLYLVETSFSHHNPATLSEQQQGLLREIANSPRLLAWYGKDEPTDYRGYLDGKLEFDKLDQGHPYASAFTDLYAVKQLGPYMDLVMIDAYDVRPGAKNNSDNLRYHADLIRFAKEYCAGGKAWLITQVFSTPWCNGSWRYPCPEEIRFDVYNSISAGVDGILFFLYNGDASYLRKTSRGETIEYSLVDLWGNGNPTFDEISRLGRVLVPIMPALANAKSVTDASFKVTVLPGAKLTHGLLRNDAGTFLVIVNRDLDRSTKGAVRISGLKGQQVFSLSNLQPVELSEKSKARFELAPGEGHIFMIGASEAYEQAKAGILQRRVQMEKEIVQVDVQLLEKAGLDVSSAAKKLESVEASCGRRDWMEAISQLEGVRKGLRDVQNSSDSYRQIGEALKRIKHDFGKINAHIITFPTRPSRTDESWDAQMEKLIQLSSRYFEFRKQWQNGQQVSKEDLVRLQKEVSALMGQIKGVKAPAK